MFEEIKNINSSKKNIRDFAIVMGLIFLVIGVYLLFKESESYIILLCISGLFIIIGFLVPVILKPLFFIWMIFAAVLGWIMTRVILSLLFYFIVAPIGIILRIFKKDFLNLNDEKNDSYWNYRNSEFELNQDYEKQF